MPPASVPHTRALGVNSKVRVTWSPGMITWVRVNVPLPSYCHPGETLPTVKGSPPSWELSRTKSSRADESAALVTVTTTVCGDRAQ